MTEDGGGGEEVVEENDRPKTVEDKEEKILFELKLKLSLRLGVRWNRKHHVSLNGH
jgi:hypothetical protein